MRVRTAADLIADLVPPPLTTYPRARAVIEEHIVALRDRLDGTEPAGPAAPIGTEFIPALRAEADGTELVVAAALPLATVAASIAELEQAS